MPITVNEFKHRVTLFKYHHKTDECGITIRKKKVVATTWAAVEPVHITSANFPKGMPKIEDGVLIMNVSYKIYLKEKEYVFHEVEWKGKRFLRASVLQEEGPFFKCIIAKIETQQIGGDL